MKVRLFRLGLDLIRYNFNAKFRGNTFAYLFDGLSENSPEKMADFLGHRFRVVYAESDSLKMLSFHHKNHRVFLLVKQTGMGKADHIPYTFLFDGSYFYYPELTRCLLDFTKLYLLYISISRLDIALDCDVTVDELFHNHKTQFVIDDIKRRYKKVVTFYLGQRKGNAKYFIRVYDKKADSMSKEKFDLFSHYVREKVVTRIEAELHPKTLKALAITPQTIMRYEEDRLNGEYVSIELMQQYFASLCMNEQGTYFYPLKDLDFSSIERLTIAKKTGRMLHPEELEKHEKLPHMKQFITRAETLYKMGIDPIMLLLIHLPRPVDHPYWEQVRTHRTISFLLPQLSFSPYEVLSLCSEIE